MQEWLRYRRNNVALNLTFEAHITLVGTDDYAMYDMLLVENSKRLIKVQYKL